jgi:hypothetical protein
LAVSIDFVASRVDPASAPAAESAAPPPSRGVAASAVVEATAAAALSPLFATPHRSRAVAPSLPVAQSNALPQTETLVTQTPREAAGSGTRTSVGSGWIALIAGLAALLAIAGIVCGLIVARRNESSTLPHEESANESAPTTTDFDPAQEMDFENPLASDEEAGSAFASDGAGGIDESAPILL